MLRVGTIVLVVMSGCGAEREPAPPSSELSPLPQASSESVHFRLYFGECETSAECEVEGEECLGGRCLLPCARDEQCPSLDINAGGCPVNLHSTDAHGDYLMQHCRGVAVVCEPIECTQDACGVSDRPRTECRARFPDGSRHRTRELRCIRDTPSAIGWCSYDGGPAPTF